MHLHWVCIGVVAAACPLCTVHAGAEERKKIQFPDDLHWTCVLVPAFPPFRHFLARCRRLRDSYQISVIF
jgi:hypothetical protein